MIRGPLQGVFERPGRATLTVVGGGLLLAVAATVLLAAGIASESVERWSEQFQPSVLLSPESTDDARRAVEATIRGWPQVKEVRRLSPEENLRNTRERLGSDAFEKLEVSAELFPPLLLVDVGEVGADEVDLTSRLQALQTRSSVDSVVYPSSQPGRWARWLRGATWVAWCLFVVCAALTLWQTTSLLSDTSVAQRRERRLLIRFGADPDTFRRSRLLRGLAVGAAIGVVGTATTWGALWGLNSSFHELFGGLVAFDQVSGRATWLLALGPALGLGAAVLAERFDGVDETRGTPSVPGLESVLPRE